MKTYCKIIFISLLIGVISCKDKNADPSPQKSISTVRIAPETPLQKTGIQYYIVVQYVKDYTEKDQIKLTVNGQLATLIEEFEGELTGTMLLFKLPSNNETGEASIKLSIDNGFETVSKEQVLRFVEEYTLSSFWQSLDKDYLSMIWESRRFRDGGFTIGQIGATSAEATTISLGRYFLTQHAYNDRVHVPFLIGLSGQYQLSFEGSSLKQLKVTHGNPLTDAQYEAQQTYDEIGIELNADLLSIETDQQNYTVRTYRKDDFTLETFANESIVYTIVTKN